MDNPINQFLTNLVFKVAEHFGFEPQEALAAVAQSQIADEISKQESLDNVSFDQTCQRLYKEISMAE